MGDMDVRRVIKFNLVNDNSDRAIALEKYFAQVFDMFSNLPRTGEVLKFKKEKREYVVTAVRYHCSDTEVAIHIDIR